MLCSYSGVCQDSVRDEREEACYLRQCCTVPIVVFGGAYCDCWKVPIVEVVRAVLIRARYGTSTTNVEPKQMAPKFPSGS